ncbi:TetR/AcrR family transcriptional regulator [Phyllobacterium myrsinacearum]|uniref:TetR/AcrR family transcriptional regulator n=1 Tax=Phyllobacterium myrsinacearum TaxID=28101 RepID=UPI0032B1C28E
MDRAAGLFARHCFEHTSLQQIADAVNYSKAGLLHHYPSKKAIYEVALTTVREHMQALVTSVEGITVGIERDQAVVEASVEFVLGRYADRPANTVHHRSDANGIV